MNGLSHIRVCGISKMYWLLRFNLVCLSFQVKDPRETRTLLLVETQSCCKPNGHSREGSESSAIDTHSMEFIMNAPPKRQTVKICGCSIDF